MPDERIVTTEVVEAPEAEAMPDAEAPLHIVTFAEADGRTTLTLLVQTTSRELRDTILESGMKAGMQEQFGAKEHVARSLR